MDKIAVSEIPAPMHAELVARVQRAKDLGLDPQFYYRVPSLRGTGIVAALLSSDRTSIGIILVAQVRQRTRVRFRFHSQVDGGETLVTASDRTPFDAPEGVRHIQLSGVDLDATWNRHQKRLRKSRSLHQYGPADVEGAIQAEAHRRVDYHVQQGVLVPLTETEVTTIRRSAPLEAG
jgi:hypothetical protein